VPVVDPGRCARHLERQHSACATRRGFLLDHAVAPPEL
jgi:hypothetical protein